MAIITLMKWKWNKTQAPLSCVAAESGWPDLFQLQMGLLSEQDADFAFGWQPLPVIPFPIH